MTDYVGAVKEFFSELLSSWAIRETGNNEHYSCGSEMFHGPSSEINCNLQIEECNV